MPPRMLLSLARELSDRACAGSNIARARTIQLSVVRLSCCSVEPLSRASPVGLHNPRLALPVHLHQQ